MSLHRREFLGSLIPSDREQGTSLPAQAVASDLSDPRNELASEYLLEVSRKAMACQFATFFPARKDSDDVATALRALDVVEELEKSLSIYRADSQISRVNQSGASRPVFVTPDVIRLLDQALKLSRLTSGAFDITAGSLSKLWGFQRKQGRIPESNEIAAALCCVGFNHLTLDSDRQTVQLAQPGVQLDLGAIGKGYAVDCAAATMHAGGVHRFLLHGGTSTVWASGDQEIRTKSEPSGSSTSAGGWLVDIRHPLIPQRRLASVRLQDKALSTSGSAVQHFFYQGKRYGHVLDPRTGYPADQVLSATALASSAAISDALSTAFFILGPEATERVCQQFDGVTAILVCAGEFAGTVRLRVFGASSDPLEWVDSL